MIAIDPGASGGMAIGRAYEPSDFLHADSTAAAFPMPKTENEVVNLICGAARLDRNEGETAYLEELVKYTGTNMPSSAMATYASNWGIIKGTLIAMSFRIVMVPPKKWQKALGLGSAKGMTKTEWKNKLKQRAQELYPKLNITLATADALLILEAARRGLLG